MDKKHGVEQCPVCGVHSLKKSTGKCVNDSCATNILELPKQQDPVKTRSVKFGEDPTGLYICGEDAATLSSILDRISNKSNSHAIIRHVERIKSVFNKVESAPKKHVVISLHPEVGNYVKLRDNSWHKVLKTSKDLESDMGVQLQNLEWMSSLHITGISRGIPNKKRHLATILNEDYKLYIFKCLCGSDLSTVVTPDSIKQLYKDRFEVRCMTCGQCISALVITDSGAEHLKTKLIHKEIENDDDYLFEF